MSLSSRLVISIENRKKDALAIKGCWRWMAWWCEKGLQLMRDLEFIEYKNCEKCNLKGFCYKLQKSALDSKAKADLDFLEAKVRLKQFTMLIENIERCRLEENELG